MFQMQRKQHMKCPGFHDLSRRVRHGGIFFIR